MYDSKKARRFKRKQYRKKPFHKKTTAVVVSKNSPWKGGIGHFSTGPDPFPNTKWCKLVYGGVYTLTVGATAGQIGTESVFNLNSLHDPDAVSGSNHQPYGHDTLAILYKNYKVYGCKVDIVYSNPDNDGMSCLARIVPPNVSAVMAGDVPALAAESPMTVMKILNSTGTQKTGFSQYIPMSKALGITPLQFKAAVGVPYAAVFGTNPSDMPTLRIGTASNTGSTTDTVQVRVRLTYYAQVYERNRLATS